MEQLEKVNYDSDIIICDNIPETISISSTPERNKKRKTKKRKRKVERGMNFDNMETLLITQKRKLKKMKVKKTKFKCIININTVCKDSSDTIVRSNNNVCKREAYYHRIVPVCLRKMCAGDSASCCRSTISRGYNYLNPKAGSLSPVSSIALTEIIDITCNNISYEDVSNGNFSTASEEELDTLIKRTRQREKQIDDLYSARDITSTPISKIDDIPSPFSIEDKKSIHSDNTMILNPLSSEAYSPTLDINKTEKLENINDTSNDLIGMDVPYSPTMTPGFVKVDSVYSPSRTNDILEDFTPYFPMYTPRSIEIEFVDCDRERNLAHTDMDAPYSPTFTPDFGVENSDNTIPGSINIRYGNEPYSPTMTPDMIKMEKFNNDVEGTYENESINVGYSPSSPTKTPDFKYESHIENSNDLNIQYTVTSNEIEPDNLCDEPTYMRNSTPIPTIFNSDLIKRENIDSQEYHISPPECNGIDYNVNNLLYFQSEQNNQRENASEIGINTERGDHASVNYVNSTSFNNHFTIKTENSYRIKTEIQ